MQILSYFLLFLFSFFTTFFFVLGVYAFFIFLRNEFFYSVDLPSFMQERRY
ncbi:hypothetical protein [Peromfec virus RodF7_10]|uniref:Uncharacterized protein n=1 Tax=Peromfec virus RodF7_10 TaxID=2929346 RepID=A0A976N2R5_9VIRU|nr:hypothetical protein [Peromfec virus RodF7_10]